MSVIIQCECEQLLKLMRVDASIAKQLGNCLAMNAKLRTAKSIDLDTIEVLLGLLNPLHGEFNRQTYNITPTMERNLAQVMLILEDRKRDLVKP